jgi:hypothetical protein
MPTSKTGPGSAPEPVLLFSNPPVKICQKKAVLGRAPKLLFSLNSQARNLLSHRTISQITLDLLSVFQQTARP